MRIPASVAKEFVSGILAMSPEALGVLSSSRGESISLYPMNTRRFSTPLFKVPSEEQAFAVWLTRNVALGDEKALGAMLAGNHQLLEKMTAVGGKPFSPLFVDPLTTRVEDALRFGLMDALSRSQAEVRSEQGAVAIASDIRLMN